MPTFLKLATICLYVTLETTISKSTCCVWLFMSTKLIAPNNVSVVRLKDYETSMKWLSDAARLKLNPQIPRKLAGNKLEVMDWQLATF